MGRKREKQRGGRMKSTGIVRKVDELGRIVLPMELRRTLNIEVRDALEIYVEGENVILKKYAPCCIFCGEGNGVEKFKEKMICQNCKKELEETL